MDLQNDQNDEVKETELIVKEVEPVLPPKVPARKTPRVPKYSGPPVALKTCIVTVNGRDFTLKQGRVVQDATPSDVRALRDAGFIG